MNKESLALLCDFYELAMSQGLFRTGMYDKTVYFDLFYREAPDKGGFVIAAGLEQLKEYVLNLKFSEDDIEFLRSKKFFNREFLDYLKSFKFTGDIYALPEGTPVFPNEPIITVRAKAPEALLIETCALIFINHQSLIATKASRIVRAARGVPVLEMGARRAQGAQGAVFGARAAYIGGCAGSSCTIAEKLYGVPSFGTMSHAWVQMFDSEYEAFKTYCGIYPGNAVLLADTYDTLKSGVPNAVKAYREILAPMGITEIGVRLDSGDLAKLSVQVRKALDAAGLKKAKIIASNSLDEYKIKHLLDSCAKIDAFGVGERLITSKSSPVLGGVYKLCAVEKDGKVLPKIKLSENEAKVNNPHYKQVYRLYDRNNGKAKADMLCVYDEVIDGDKPLKIYTDREITVDNYFIRPMLKPVIKNGRSACKNPDIRKIQSYCKEQLDALGGEFKRLNKPAVYPVGLSNKLRKIKADLLENASRL